MTQLSNNGARIMSGKGVESAKAKIAAEFQAAMAHGPTEVCRYARPGEIDATLIDQKDPILARFFEEVEKAASGIDVEEPQKPITPSKEEQAALIHECMGSVPVHRGRRGDVHDLGDLPATVDVSELIRQCERTLGFKPADGFKLNLAERKRRL